MKRCVFCCILFSLLLCMAVSCADSVWDEAFTAENVRLEHVSLTPKDLSVFTVREARSVAVSLSEENAAELFKNALPLAMGPDGAVLWLEDVWEEEPSLFVQRDREILKLSTGDASIMGYLRNCFSQYDGRKYGLKKPAGWSADSRYISLLARGDLIETPPFLLDTHTGEIAPIFPSEGPADFLAENGLKSCRADYGLMSVDGRSLYLVMILFGDEMKDANGASTEDSPAIVRYDMEADTLSLVCRLQYMPGSDFSEIDTHHLLVGSGEQTILITLDDSGIATDISSWSIDPDEPPTSREIDKYSGIYKTIPVADTPYVLLMIPGDTNSVMLWPDYSYSLPGADFVLLNTETMESRVLPADSVWTYDCLSNAIRSTTDAVIRDDILFLGGTAYRLNLSPDPDAGAGSESDPELIRLNTAELGVDLESVAYARKYRLRGSISPDSLEYMRIATIDGYEVSTEITVLHESYQITVTFDRIETPIVPAALTVDRYKEIKGTLNGRNMKKLASIYTKITPEKLDQRRDKVELLQTYPSLKEQPLYILKSDIHRDILESAESILREAGYTEADYKADMQLVSAETDSREMSSRGIYYLLRSDEDIAWHPGPVSGLLFLTDYLSGTLYTQYMTADPRPASADSLPVTGTIEFEYIPYEVTLDSVAEEDLSTVFTFTAVPVGVFGWLQR